MAYSNPTPPPMAPGPSTGNRIDIKPGPMPPIVQPPPTPGRMGRYDPAMIAEIMARRRAALSRLQPILGGGRGIPKNELPAPTTKSGRARIGGGGGVGRDGWERNPVPRGGYNQYQPRNRSEIHQDDPNRYGFDENGNITSQTYIGWQPGAGSYGRGGRFMDGRGTLGEMPIRMPEGGWPRGPGGYEAMPLPAQITPEMVQRWWNGGGQYGNPQQGGIIGAGLGRTAGDRGVGLPPPGMPANAGGPMVPPPLQAMLPDQGVNQAPSRPQRPQRPPRPPRPQGPYEFTNVDDINNRYGVDASNWYDDNGLTDYGRQGFAQILAERFGQINNVNDINNRFGVDANGWYDDSGAITDQGRQGWLAYMMSMNPYYGGF